MALLIRALPPFLHALPYALIGGVVVAAVTWLVWREKRRRLQFVLTALAFGIGFAVNLQPMVTGIAFMALGGDSDAAAHQADLFGWGSTAGLLLGMLATGWFVERRSFLPAIILAVAFVATMLFFTGPVSFLRG